MTARPGDGKHAERAEQAGRGYLRASHNDRDLVVGHLKAAFVAGQLTWDEFGQRLAAALGGRTYADLAALTADLPPVPAAPAPQPARRDRPDGRRPVLQRTTTRVLVGSTAGYLLLWVSAVALVLLGQLGGGVLLVLLGTFCYLLTLGVTAAEILSQRRERRRSRGQAGRAGGGAGPRGQVSPPRSRPRVASRSSWNCIHTRWHESRSGASIHPYCPACARVSAVAYRPA